MMNPRILLVEDDPLLKDALVASLAALGFAVMSFENPKEALAVAADFEIIHTDGNLPAMNGVEFTRAARRLNPNAFICMFSGEQDFEQAFRAAGGDAFLNKCDFSDWHAFVQGLKCSEVRVVA